MRVLPALASLVLALGCSAVRIPDPPYVPILGLEQAEAELRERCPTRLPVEVRYQDVPGYLGLTMGEGHHVLILIDDDQPFQVMLDTLIHEWAHAVVWGVERPSPHDEMWGAAVSRAYRALREEPAGSGQACGRR